MMKEEREVNNSTPSSPKTSMTSASMTIGRPVQEGEILTFFSRLRLCHNTNNEKAGTKKPCEKLGSPHHWTARRYKIEW